MSPIPSVAVVCLAESVFSTTFGADVVSRPFCCCSRVDFDDFVAADDNFWLVVLIGWESERTELLTTSRGDSQPSLFGGQRGV